MLRVRWLVLELAALSLLAFCNVSSAPAQRGGAGPCPYSPNLTYQFQVQWTAVGQPGSPGSRPAFTPRSRPTRTPSVRPSLPTREEPRGERPAPVRRAPIERTYPTREETVHHDLSLHIERTTERVRIVETRTREEVIPRPRVPGIGPGRPEEPIHRHVSYDLQRYEQKEHVRLRLEDREHPEVKYGERHVVEQRGSERWPTDMPQRRPAIDERQRPDDPQRREPTPDRERPGSGGGVRWIPKVTVTAKLDFQCGQCHHKSLPQASPLMSKPQCLRPTQSMTAIPMPGRSLPPVFLDWPAQSPSVPALTAPGPIASLPPIILPDPSRKTDRSLPIGITDRPSQPSLWDDGPLLASASPLDYPQKAASLKSDDGQQRRGSSADGSQQKPTGRSDASQTRPAEASQARTLSPGQVRRRSWVPLDLIFEAAPLPSAVAMLRSIQQYSDAQSALPSVVEIVLDPPALSLPGGDWAAAAMGL